MHRGRTVSLEQFRSRRANKLHGQLMYICRDVSRRGEDRRVLRDCLVSIERYKYLSCGRPTIERLFLSTDIAHFETYIINGRYIFAHYLISRKEGEKYLGLRINGGRSKRASTVTCSWGPESSC